MSDDEPPIEVELIRSALLFEDLLDVDTQVTPTVGDEDYHVRITLKVDDEIVESSAIGLIFTLGALSFNDARPRGVSGKWLEEKDELTVADMLRHLRFERGKLRMYIDYLRGRCLKTTVEVSSDGTIVLDTVNRGQAAIRWVERLRGKKVLEPVPNPA